MFSTSTVESTIVHAPANDVWDKLKAMDFTWWELVKEVNLKAGTHMQVGSTYELHFCDGSKWDIVISEISQLVRSLAFEVLAAEPAVGFSSVIHTMKVTEVTSDNSSFVQWTSEFSGDATNEVVLDSKFKRLEAFKNLELCFN